MKIICGFAAFTSELGSLYWKRMGSLISVGGAENIWQSKHCVLCGDICERACDGHIYAASGCSKDVLEEYIKSGELSQDEAGAIWDGKNERLIVFTTKTEIFYANPYNRFVFSNTRDGLNNFPGVYDVPHGGISSLSPSGIITFDKNGRV